MPELLMAPPRSHVFPSTAANAAAAVRDPKQTHSLKRPQQMIQVQVQKHKKQKLKQQQQEQQQQEQQQEQPLDKADKADKAGEADGGLGVDNVNVDVGVDVNLGVSVSVSASVDDAADAEVGVDAVASVESTESPTPTLDLTPTPTPPATPTPVATTKKKSAWHCENSLTILDWDDTLLSTSWLAGQGVRLDTVDIPAEVRTQLAVLEEAILRVLTRALAMGKVAILTNAESQWVELSARRFVPRVCDLLRDVRVLSARSSFEALFPGDAQRWKLEGYKLVFNEAGLADHPGASSSIGSGIGGSISSSGSIGSSSSGSGSGSCACNVLSLGDSPHERAALLALAEGSSQVVPKSVKFLQKPCLERLVRQLDIVDASFLDLFHAESARDLMLQLEYA